MSRICLRCGEEILDARALLGYDTCLPCGELFARSRKHCVVPLNKSNYIVVSNRDELKQLNPKRVG